MHEKCKLRCSKFNARLLLKQHHLCVTLEKCYEVMRQEHGCGVTNAAEDECLFVKLFLHPLGVIHEKCKLRSSKLNACLLSTSIEAEVANKVP